MKLWSKSFNDSLCAEISKLPPKEQVEHYERLVKACPRPLYLDFKFYAAISPVLIAVIGVLTAWTTGWLKVEEKKVNVRIAELNVAATNLAGRIELLEREKALLTSELSRLRDIEADRRDSLQMTLQTSHQQTTQLLTTVIENIAAKQSQVESVLATETNRNEAEKKVEQLQAEISTLEAKTNEIVKREEELIEARFELIPIGREVVFGGDFNRTLYMKNPIQSSDWEKSASGQIEDAARYKILDKVTTKSFRLFGRPIVGGYSWLQIEALSGKNHGQVRWFPWSPQVQTVLISSQ